MFNGSVLGRAMTDPSPIEDDEIIGGTGTAGPCRDDGLEPVPYAI